MKVAVIGAGGFVGSEILRQMAGIEQVNAISAIDRIAPPENAKTTSFVGDFSNTELRAKALEGADAVIHLATILGGAAEADHTLARRINVDTTLDLADELKSRAPETRFVFASTIAAYGKPLPDAVTDSTPLNPTMLYGAQKVMMEVMLSNYARRGWLDAVSLRPSGVMARDGAPKALKSAFMSRLFYCVMRGEDITLPVAADNKTWLASVRNVAANFVHAALLPELSENRAFTLPALALTYGELVDALKRRFPNSPSTVRFEPDPETVALFGGSPDLVTQTAEALGFSKDNDADALVLGALEEE